jgi:hypothetical protein
MGSFVDKKRSAPPEPQRRVRIYGYDPDTDVAGWGVLTAWIGGTPRIESAVLCIEKCASSRTGQGKADDASFFAARMAASRLGASALDGAPQYVIVEGQQVYPDPDASRQKIIAQANDLLHLALVAGAVLGVAVAKGCHTKVPLPAEWKKQRKKAPDHKRSGDILIKHGVGVLVNDPETGLVTTDPRSLTTLDRRWEHALDALGIALYGFDLLSTNRWGT